MHTKFARKVNCRAFDKLWQSIPDSSLFDIAKQYKTVLTVYNTKSLAKINLNNFVVMSKFTNTIYLNRIAD